MTKTTKKAEKSVKKTTDELVKAQEERLAVKEEKANDNVDVVDNPSATEEKLIEDMRQRVIAWDAEKELTATIQNGIRFKKDIADLEDEKAGRFHNMLVNMGVYEKMAQLAKQNAETFNG